MSHTCKGILSGRLAVVTGGASGIGRAICVAFAREGARVAIADVNLPGAEETLTLMKDSNKHVAKYVDVSKSSSVNKFFAELKENFGVADILVNCAAIMRMYLLVETTEEMYDDMFGVNMKGIFLMTRAAAKQMIEANVAEGSVVNISSITAKAGLLTQSVYSATKAAVDGFTKVISKELAEYGIRCNTIRPGFTDTPLTKDVSDELRKDLINKTPLRRIGKPEEIAETCVFLASSKSSFTTGSLVQVSGGQDA